MTAPAKILVVDDTPHNVKLLADLLIADGYHVSTAASGPEALQRLTEGQDLVLLDVVMPGMSGYEVCRKIRESPETQKLRRYGNGARPERGAGERDRGGRRRFPH